MPNTETLTETELAEIEAIYAYLPEPSELEELIGTGERARVVSRLLREDVPALCRSLRAAWAANQQIIEVVDDTNKQIQSLKSEVAALRAQLAQVEKERKGCEHCSCTCDGCAPCGEMENL